MFKLVARMLKLFVALSSRLNVLHNYSNSLIKLFLNLYLTKFLDTSKLFFSNKYKNKQIICSISLKNTLNF